MHALDGRAHAHDLLLTQAFSFTLTARVRALSISLPPSYKRSQTLSLSCFGLQAKAWKAGHKRECEEAKNRKASQLAAEMTADRQRQLYTTLSDHGSSGNWRGVAAQASEAKAVAANLRAAATALRTAAPSSGQPPVDPRNLLTQAAWIYGILGVAYRSLGDWGKAIEYFTESLAISQEAGDRSGEASALANLGIAYDSLGDVPKSIECHTQCLAIAQELGDRTGESMAYGNLGNACDSLGDCGKAIECHTQCLAIARELGDRAGEGRAYTNLGTAWHSQGNFSKAIEYHKQRLVIAQELGDRAGRAYGSLGNSWQSLGDYSQAIEYYLQRLAIAEEIKDRAGESRAYAGLGIAYQSQGDFAKAIEYHSLDLEFAMKMNDWKGRYRALGNLGNGYASLKDFPKAIEYHKQHLAMAKEVGDRAGEGKAYGNLGNCHLRMEEYVQAVSYHEVSHTIATELKLEHMQAQAALGLGLALCNQVRADRRGPAGSPADVASQAPGPHSHWSASASVNDRAREAAKWLQAAFDGGHKSARLHLAHLAFTAGEEDTALARLKEHLSCVCKTDVTLVPGVGKCGEWKLKCSRASSVPYEVRRPARLPRRTIFSRCICRCSRMRARLPLHTLLHTQVSR